MFTENFSFTNYNATEFIWDGPNIPCLQLCTKDKVSDVVYKLGKKVCDILTGLDALNELDLSCVIDKCDKTLCLEDRSLLSLFKIMNANDCSIKKLIDTTVDAINKKKNITFNLDLSCLKTCPDYTVSKYDFICAEGGNVGDTVEVTYNTLYDPTPKVITLKNKECVRFNRPQYAVTIISFVPINGSLIVPIVKSSIGFDNCPDCDTSGIIDASIPGCYKTLDFSITALLQYMINRLCCQDTTLTAAESHVTNIEKQYTEIVDSYSTYKEPKVISCLNTSPILHSLLTSRLDAYVCSLRNNLGTHDQVLASISAGCNARWVSTDFPDVACSPTSLNSQVVNFLIIDGITYNIGVNIGGGGVLDVVNVLNSILPASLAHFSAAPSGQLTYSNIANSVTLFMIGCDGITPYAVHFNTNYISATNLAQDNFNQWSVLCDILGRLKSKENSACCLPSCDDIKLGYKLIYDNELNAYTIVFNSVYGTVIPVGWTDSGSILQVTDSDGVISRFDIEITEDYSFDIDLVGLQFAKPMTLAIKTSFVNTNGLHCNECLTDILQAVSNACSFCRVCATASNDTDLIKVLYTTADNSTVRSQTLSNGGCITFKIPDEKPTIKASYVLTTGSDITIGHDPTSDCDEDMEFPDSFVNTCWFFKIPISSSFRPFIEKGNGLVVPFVFMDFDMENDSTYTYVYDSIETSINPNLTLTGQTIANGGFVKGHLIAPTSPDILTLEPALPTSITQPILSAKKCSKYDIQHNGALSDAGGIGMLPHLSTHKNITFSYTEGDTTFGIILEISAQDPAIPPVLNLKDPITNTVVSIKGEYLDSSCDCQ